VLSLDFLNDKVGTDMAVKESKSTFGHSCLEPHERLNVIGSPNFRCFIELSRCGSGFLLRAHFHGRLELDMRVQPALQHALLEYRLCRDWRDWRPNWISFSTQPIACLHGNKVTAFSFCLPFCPKFPPVQASHGNALL
jgi:hypothetical protein